MADYRQFVLTFPHPLRFYLARDPTFLSRMLRRHLGCGQLSRGLLRVRCSSCGHEKLVAPS